MANTTKRGASEQDLGCETPLEARLRSSKKVKIEGLQTGSKTKGHTSSRKGPAISPESLRPPRLTRQVAIERAEIAEAEVDRLEGDCSRLRRENQYLKDKRLEGIDQGRDHLQDDYTIQSNLQLLFQLIKSWAGEYAKEGYLMQHMGMRDALNIVSLLEGKRESFPFKILRSEATDKYPWSPVACRLTVEAYLAHKITQLLILRPFHFMSDRNTNDLVGYESKIDNLVCYMTEQQASRQLWMSLTLRSLYDTYQYAGPVIDPIDSDRFAASRSQQYNTVIRRILDSEQSLISKLLRPCDVSEIQLRQRELYKILRTAGKISLQLWAQDAKVEAFYQLDTVRGACYAFDSDVTEPHSLMKAFSEDDDLRGLKIDFVVRPCIKLTRFEGGHQQKHVIAAKASVIVLMGENWEDNREKHAKAQMNKTSRIKIGPEGMLDQSDETTTEGEAEKSKELPVDESIAGADQAVRQPRATSPFQGFAMPAHATSGGTSASVEVEKRRESDRSVTDQATKFADCSAPRFQGLCQSCSKEISTGSQNDMQGQSACASPERGEDTRTNKTSRCHDAEGNVIDGKFERGFESNVAAAGSLQEQKKARQEEIPAVTVETHSTSFDGKERTVSLAAGLEHRSPELQGKSEHLKVAAAWVDANTNGSDIAPIELKDD